MLTNIPQRTAGNIGNKTRLIFAASVLCLFSALRVDLSVWDSVAQPSPAVGAALVGVVLLFTVLSRCCCVLYNWKRQSSITDLDRIVCLSSSSSRNDAWDELLLMLLLGFRDPIINRHIQPLISVLDTASYSHWSYTCSWAQLWYKISRRV